ncbi:MAG: hypothetical protein IIY78_01215, partial [Clostridia bacterium]|nr:hypothetical protein [Clostridia bacterium]
CQNENYRSITPPSRLLSQPSGTVPNRRGRFPTVGNGSQPPGQCHQLKVRQRASQSFSPSLFSKRLAAGGIPKA